MKMPAGKDENRFTIIPNHGTLRSGECSVVVEKIEKVKIEEEEVKRFGEKRIDYDRRQEYRIK